MRKTDFEKRLELSRGCFLRKVGKNHKSSGKITLPKYLIGKRVVVFLKEQVFCEFCGKERLLICNSGGCVV